MSSTTTGSSWVNRQINVTITLGTGTFGQSGQNTVKLQNLRVVASINKGGMPSLDQANVRIYGVQPSIMNQVSTLGIPLTMIRLGNTVTIEAGNSIDGFSIVYYGYMHQCWQNFNDAPDTFLEINAFGGYPAALQPASPRSYPENADVATIMSGLAEAMGMQFENSGVQTKLQNGYYPGTNLQQAHEVARAANIEMYLDSSTPTGTLAIWPKTGTRHGAVPLVSSGTGLVGYPKFMSNGMSFRTLYNPNIQLGGQIQMQSSLGTGSSPAVQTPIGSQPGGPNGIWYVAAGGGGLLSHSLSAQIPGGPWFTDVQCVRVPGVPGAA